MDATHDMEELTSKFGSNGPLEWVVNGLPVVALFKDPLAHESESLGQPLNRNGGADLQLWIRCNQDTRELLVVLSIYIKLSPNRKKPAQARKKALQKGRLMVYIIPAESLTLRSECLDYQSLENLPEHLCDMPNDAESGKCQLLRLSFDIGCIKRDVVMPKYERATRAQPQSLSLLRKLKTVSESSRFDLYTNHDNATQDAAARVCTMLVNTNMTTPPVDITKLYPGGRSGCVNDWEMNGWSEKEPSRRIAADEVIDNNIREAPSPSAGEGPPPPYEIPRPPSTARSGLPPLFLSAIAPAGLPATLPSLPSTAAAPSPPVPAGSLVRSSPPQSAYQRASVPTTVSTSGPSVVDGIPPTMSLGSSRIFSSVPPLPPSTPEQTLSPDYSATFLSGPTNNPSTHGLVLDSPTRKRNLPPSSKNADNSPKRVANQTSGSQGTSGVQHQRALSNPEIVPSPTIADNSSCLLPNTAGVVDTNTHSTPGIISLWLRKAWAFSPNAHYIFVTPLLHLAAAIRGGNTQAIAVHRVACTIALLAHCTNTHLAGQPADAVADAVVDADVKALVEWLYALHPGADMECFGDLVQLAVSRRVLGAREAYMQLKADIVAKACVNLGKEVSLQERGVNAAAVRMQRARCGV